MNKDKARQCLIASRNISKDTPVARRVAFLREAARAYVTEFPKLSARLNMSATTLARENELSRAQINAYGSCPACGLEKEEEGVTCRLCRLPLKKKTRRRPKVVQSK